MAKEILVLVYNGVADWEVSFPLFCLHPKIQARFASPGGPTVRTVMGFEKEVSLPDLDRIDVEGFGGVYLPGGLDPETQRFPRGLGENPAIVDLLRRFSRSNKVTAAICGAPLILGAAGLLKGRRFACDITEDTRGWFEGAERSAEPLCSDGSILTASVSAIIPFSSELARLLGEDQTAEEIKGFFVKG
jgi:putative intracellular protease/amidase